jgi:hypothetical protein
MASLNQMTREWMSAIERAGIGRVVDEHYDAHAVFLPFSVVANSFLPYWEISPANQAA